MFSAPVLLFDWLMREATSVSRRKPESSHFTHRLRGIWENVAQRQKMEQRAVGRVRMQHTQKKKQGGGVISQNIEEETEQKKGNLGERSEIFSFHPPSPPPPFCTLQADC